MVRDSWIMTKPVNDKKTKKSDKKIEKVLNIIKLLQRQKTYKNKNHAQKPDS